MGRKSFGIPTSGSIRGGIRCAEEKLRHLAEVAYRNEFGEHIRVLIDGEFVTPRLSNE